LLNFLEKIQNNCTDLINHAAIYSPAFLESFDHTLHLVTLAVLAIFFFDRWKVYLVRMRLCVPVFFKVVGLTALADIVTAFFYIFFKLYPVQLPLVVGFGITAMSLLSIYFISIDPSTSSGRTEIKYMFKEKFLNFILMKKYREKAKQLDGVAYSPVLPELCRRGKGELNIYTAFILGLVQGIALLPGISRLATTYAAARWLGMQPRKAFEVSWLIAVPLFFAASMQGIYKIMYMPHAHELVVGFLPYILPAGLLAYIALKITAYLFYTHRAWWFGVYMLLPISLALKMYLL
jgi:undecaprenyl pyrophosphate phosphatase UppP